MALAFLIRFLQWSTVGLITPVFTLLQMSKGLDLAQVGLATAILSAVVVILEIPTGLLSDAIGRKRVFLLSLVVAAGAYLSLLFVQGFLPLVIALSVYGVSRALSSGSIEALLIDKHLRIHGPDSLHRMTTLLTVAETLGLAGGALAGGYIAQAWPGMGLGGGSYDGNLWLIAIICGILFLIVGIAVREETHETEKHEKGIKPALVFLKDNSVLKTLMFGSLIWGLSFCAVESFWQPHVAGLLGGTSQGGVLGLLASGYFLLSVAGAALAGLLLEKTKLPHFLTIGVSRLINGILMAVMFVPPNAPGFAVVYLLMFFCNGVANPPESTAFNLQAPPAHRATLLSISSFSMQIGGVVGGLAWAAVVEPLGIPGVWAIAGTAFAASSILFFAGLRKKPDPGKV